MSTHIRLKSYLHDALLMSIFPTDGKVDESRDNLLCSPTFAILDLVSGTQGAHIEYLMNK